MIAVETLRRAEAILEGLAAGEEPGALANAPLAESWATIAGEDIYRIGALVAVPPEVRARAHIDQLLAIDRVNKWALVISDGQVSWWRLGTAMAAGSAPQDDSEVARRAMAWVRRWLQGS